MSSVFSQMFLCVLVVQPAVLQVTTLLLINLAGVAHVVDAAAGYTRSVLISTFQHLVL